MEGFPLGVLVLGLAGLLVAGSAEGAEDAAAKAIEAAAPDQAPAKPAAPRKVLVYGRVPTHGDSVRFCFSAIEILGTKSGAFEAVSSGDPAVFLPDSLKQFDAIVMNNTHESNPLLPANFKELSLDQQNAAKEREVVLKKSLLDFVAGGKGLVGIHGAACSVRWPEYMDMLGGSYTGHTSGPAWVKPDDPGHPLCALLPKEGFETSDEFYILGGPYSREKVRVLTSLDLSKTADPQKLKVKDYPVSWVRGYGKGRVFYCSLGHTLASYRNPHVLRHILAGIQYALGDLATEGTPSGKVKQQGPMEAYDPLSYENLARSVVRALMEREPEPLPPSTPFPGPGVYAIYYLGGFPAYAPIASPSCERPIYVGKAIPPGARKGLGELDATGDARFRRLQDHAKSLQCAKNLALADFRCRHLVVVPVWVTLAERFLLSHYRPIWNCAIDGFGNHDPGKGRRNMRRPRWDILHPGRPWAAGLDATETAEQVLAALRSFLTG